MDEKVSGGCFFLSAPGDDNKNSGDEGISLQSFIF